VSALRARQPVVIWGGWPFFLRGWQSIVNRSLNMFTLIALGTGIAYVYSAAIRALLDLAPKMAPIMREDVDGVSDLSLVSPDNGTCPYRKPCTIGERWGIG
jgi:hypothetical protein